MFGNPEWFRPKAMGFGLVPKAWQGWAYSAGWGGTIGLPFFLLLGRHQSLEALLWLALAVGAMAYDVWQILMVIRRSQGKPGVCRQAKDSDVLYIMDNGPVQVACDCKVGAR